MAISSEKKQELIIKFGKEKTNTGSVHVQVAILTSEIKALTEHLAIHKKDYSSQRALFIKVSKRKNLLNYLKRKDITQYRSLIKELGLRN